MRRSIIFLAVISLLVLLITSSATASLTVNQFMPAASLDGDKDGKDKVLPPDLKKRLPPAVWERVGPILQHIEEQIKEIKAGENYIKGERIVVFKPATPKNKIEGIVAKVGPLSVKDIGKYGAKGAEKVIKLLKFESEDKARQAESELKKDPNVLYVAKNFKVKVPPVKREEFRGKPEIEPKAPTADPYRSYQWYLFKTKEQFAPFAPTAPMVAVIDTGVQYDHPELLGRVILGSDYVDGDNNPYDENGHGTAVAGIIGAKVNNGVGIAGISPKSRIYAVRVLDGDGNGTFDNIIAGIIEACNNTDVKIINLSLGGYVEYPSDEYFYFEDVIDYCVYGLGKIVVSAAGNEANIPIYLFDDPETPYYDLVPVPAAIPSSFTVAATDEVDARVWFSNYGTNTLSYVDIAAPGLRILTLDIYSTYHVWYGGTSFSAPIVAAAAARVWGKNPGWTNIDVMNNLVATGRALNNVKGFPVSTKRVDIAKALGIILTGIQGQIIDAENSDWFLNTLGGARVRATAVKYAFSNNGGFYTITGLAPGTYTLTVSKGGYVTQTRTVSVTSGSITEDVDFYMVRVKPTEYRTVVTTWNSFNPGLEEWLYTFWYGLEHPDIPQWQDTAGREMNLNFHILPDNIRVNWQNPYSASPYAEILVDSWWVERPVETLVYKPVSGKTYRYGLGMSPYDYCWGKLPGSGAVTRVFRGTSITNTISSATATGTADFWWHVYNQAGTAAITTINRRVPMFGVAAPSPLPSIILVDDDASWFFDDYSDWFKSALTDAGYSYTYWDVFEAGPPSLGDLSPYAIVIWFTGDDWTTTLRPYERSALASYLSLGKRLFITGQDIGFHLNMYAKYSSYAPSQDAILWYETWLKAEYAFDAIDAMMDDSGHNGILALTGIDGDPISDPLGPPEGNEMMLVIWNGDGADNQYSADGIIPISGSAAIFYYLNDEGDIFIYGDTPIAGGVRFPSPVPAPSTPYRLVYLSFGFEAISDAGMRAELIDEIIKFLTTGS